ncbi:Similar to endoglucanase (Endo-1,4-beta-D-glucanase; carboxymethylcellulase) [Desulfamplus magnetovallimortis]|uniref:cellulase n=1 Tax=Desulfamplus magnetovallimortis TaxID=1246637 RepID=A0A1W1HIX9_9BACT|nr:glycosyl hydrolase family 8 [Desulfamplus magnetovallimortis]SLM32434.1 Similar to endoglucanase (Endo-1,4-beta-D-glucanase; carboxymethylcellulase) [Desulfamplus magnetovallimortis]
MKNKICRIHLPWKWIQFSMFGGGLDGSHDRLPVMLCTLCIVLFFNATDFTLSVFDQRAIPISKIFSLTECHAEDGTGNVSGTWKYYKSRFISKDGRVIDVYQNNISHSEGQGYGLLLSLNYNDKKTFDLVLQWTQNNLMARKDGLAAWSWGERHDGKWGILDYNNATDGDILIAWALLEGVKKWNNEVGLSDGRNIITAIKKYLVTDRQGRQVLLPAYYGFSGKNELKINPAYFVFPAFRAFAKSPLKDISTPMGDVKFWQTLYMDSLEIVKKSCSTNLLLPPDWIFMDENGNILSLSEHGKKSNFGFEAIRIPLYLAMAEEMEGLKLFSTYIKFLETQKYMPMVVDLFDEQISLHEASAGFHAVMAICAGVLGNAGLEASLMKRADEKIRQEKDDYYSNTLYLLARTIKVK